MVKKDFGLRTVSEETLVTRNFASSPSLPRLTKCNAQYHNTDVLRYTFCVKETEDFRRLCYLMDHSIDTKILQ